MAKLGRRDDSINSDWAELTHECLTNILSRVSLEDRCKGAMFVCKSWFHASKDPTLFSVINLETVFESSDNDESSSRWWWSPDFERKINSMLQSTVNLSVFTKEIRIRHCSDQSLLLVDERCPKLQVLSIKSCPNVTDISIAKIASGCPMLMELDISYCHKISHTSLELIGRHCPNLKILKRNLMNLFDPSSRSQYLGIVPDEYLNASPKNGNLEAAAIGNFMPNLVHLELQFSNLNPVDLNSIQEGCPELEYLDLFGCLNLSSQLKELVKELMIKKRQHKKFKEDLKTIQEEKKQLRRKLEAMENQFAQVQRKSRYLLLSQLTKLDSTIDRSDANP